MKSRAQSLVEAAAVNTARLLGAARHDAAFRARLLLVIRLPSFQRMSLIQGAVAEMKLKGQRSEDILAFSALANDDVAAAVQREIEERR